jgi:hypothetical protein
VDAAVVVPDRQESRLSMDLVSENARLLSENARLLSENARLLSENAGLREWLEAAEHQHAIDANRLADL